MRLSALSLLMISLSFHSVAVDDCNNITDTLLFNRCSYKKRDIATLKVDNEFKKYLKGIEKNYSADMNPGNQLISMAQDSQLKWREYMKVMCDITAFQVDESNITHHVLINICISDMSEKRVAELSRMINNI